jgi:hypothetical protein
MTTRRLDARAGFGVLAVALIWMTAWFAVLHTGGLPTIAIGAAVDFTATAGLAVARGGRGGSREPAARRSSTRSRPRSSPHGSPRASPTSSRASSRW